MKTYLSSCFLFALWLILSGCKKETVDQTSCAPSSRVVKAVTGAEGIVGFNQTLQRYTISSHQSGTYDVIDVGVVCGNLPDDMKIDRTKIMFSGNYKEYGTQPKAPVGVTYYYLDLSTAQIQ